VQRIVLPVAVAVCAASLVVLAASPGPGARSSPDRAGAPAWSHRAATVFVQSLAELGRRPRNAWTEGDTVFALYRHTQPGMLPRIDIDAALAAAAVVVRCGCPVRAYEVVTDRFGPELTTLAAGTPIFARDTTGRLDDRLVRMEGASDLAVRMRARELAAEAVRVPARRVSRTIVRDGQIVWALALRPATGRRKEWSTPSLEDAGA
jgi:hypothetical protein